MQPSSSRSEQGEGERQRAGGRGPPIRTRPAELASALGEAAGVCAKIARDVVLLRTLVDVLLDEPDVTRHMAQDRLRKLLDPAEATGNAALLVDRALAHHETLGVAREALG
jgi:adenylosuccinate lyase